MSAPGQHSRAGSTTLLTVRPWGAPFETGVGVKIWLTPMSERFADWDKYISHIIKANSDVQVAELSLRRHVTMARQAGHSWASIGFALGITRQAAQQRFGADGAPSG
jgi:hypothetical protein